MVLLKNLTGLQGMQMPAISFRSTPRAPECWLVTTRIRTEGAFLSQMGRFGFESFDVIASWIRRMAARKRPAAVQARKVKEKVGKRLASSLAPLTETVTKRHSGPKWGHEQLVAAVREELSVKCSWQTDLQNRKTRIPSYWWVGPLQCQ